MLSIFIATHGKLAEGLINSAEMIYGELEDLETVCLHQNEGIVLFEKTFKEKLQQALTQYSGAIVLCDLQGGTPYNIACKEALTHSNIAVITGVNLPMVLMSQDYITESDAHSAAHALLEQALGSLTVKNLTHVSASTNDDDNF